MGGFVSVADRLLAEDARLGRLVAGFDEVGRGALAGSICGAVVCYDTAAAGAWLDELYEVRDSKTLSRARRESAAAGIRRRAVAYTLLEYPCDEVDAYGIQACNRGLVDSALELAEGWGCDALVVDGLLKPARRPRSLRLEVRPRADGSSLAAASASIIAKVARDAAMAEADILYPGYGFSGNVGYGSPDHIAALGTLGTCPLHRESFLTRLAVARHG